MRTSEAITAFGSISAASRALGIPRTTLQGRLIREKANATIAPAEPPKHLPIEALLEQASQRFDLAKGISDAQHWPVIEIKDKKPIGVLWFGDPHLGDNGCNVPLLRKHAKLCADTPGLYGANIGDTTNNWMTAGKLSKQWAEQDTSLATERRLAEWLMLESGVNWLVWLIGNHDAWNSGETILRGMNAPGIFMQNWEARFKFNFPTGEQIRVHAAHNFKGFSDWNPMHGPLKAAIKTSDADLYVAGHIHTPGSMQINIEGSDRFPLMLRVASYKRFDLYAKLGGFTDHSVGCAVLTIFNPGATDRSGKITHFFDVELGARVLTMMRGNWGHEGRPSEGRRAKNAARAPAAGRADVSRARPTVRGGKVQPSRMGKRNAMGPDNRGSEKAHKRIRGGK